MSRRLHLLTIWAVTLGSMLSAAFILEGFDFGVGMLHSLVGQDEPGRRAAINTIGPLWDGNEVWLIVAGASDRTPGAPSTTAAPPGRS